MKKPLTPAPVLQGATPAAFDSSDATAVQALATGTANEGQQKRALDWILKGACGLPQWAYRDTERETNIALGRQFVGQQIVGLINLNVSMLKKREEKQHA